MKRLILTRKEPLKGHFEYCLVVLNNDLAESRFNSTIDFNGLNPTIDLDKDLFYHPWDLRSIKTHRDLLTHPSIITYTEDSHPEMFI